MTNDTIDSTPINSDDAVEYLWQELLGWLNSDQTLPQEAKDIFISRSSKLRLRMQAIVLEMQRKMLTQIADDVFFEDYLRQSMMENVPYMSARERQELYKTLETTNRDRLERLESQLQGFDFFQTIEVSVQNVKEANVSKLIKDRVLSVPSIQRQKLLNALNDVINDAEVQSSLVEKDLNESS